MKTHLITTTGVPAVAQAIIDASSYLGAFSITITTEQRSLDLSLPIIYEKRRANSGTGTATVKSLARGYLLSLADIEADCIGLIADKKAVSVSDTLNGQHSTYGGRELIEVYRSTGNARRFGKPATSYVLIHELLHALAAYHGVSDKLHQYVADDRSGSLDRYRASLLGLIRSTPALPSRTIAQQTIAVLQRLIARLQFPSAAQLPSPAIPVAAANETPVKQPPAPSPTVPKSEVLIFETPKAAYHATRVIADELGLTFEQKEILCACIYQESRFRNRYADGSPVTNPNRGKDGTVWSTDWGIVQVNDYWHIGKGKTFSSLAYVIDNPELMVRWMAGTMKRTGALQPWSSYVSGAYKQWLSPTSPIRALKS